MSNNISMVEAKLPPGFRFHPRDEELICDYLVKKVTYSDSSLMMEVDLNKCEPWDIPETACVGGKEWYFYTQRDRKYATGLRTNRATACGYWKATGKDRAIHRKGTLVGMRKTLVFYQGRAPKGTKSDWVMHEFRLHAPYLSSLKEDWVLCRVFYKNREGGGGGGGGGKASMGSCYEDTGCSSTLPALMDSYITFDQTERNIDEYEQVPCFSIFTPNQTNLTLSHITHMEPNIPTSFGGILPLPLPLPPHHLDSCDQNVLKAVLNQLMETKGSPSFGDGTTSESYISEPPAFSTMWNH